MLESYSFINNELEALEAYLMEKFPQKGGILTEASQKTINAGGKRLRPILAILSGMFGEYSRDKIIPLAAALETLHSATLVHDDIIDNAETRRGQPSVSAKHGINLAVYAGDYMLVKAVMMLSEAGLPAEKLKEVAQALESMCVGEVEQYLGRNKVPTVREYLKRIMRKTGILLSASCSLGAFSAGCSEEQVKVLGRFGMYFGTAFQIRDDLLDIEPSEFDKDKIGKPVIRDLKEGVITLPVILAAYRNTSVRKQLESFFSGQGDVASLIPAIVAAGGPAESRRIKNRYINKCLGLLEGLPDTKQRRAMEEAVLWLGDSSFTATA
ncbi:MAG: polyprenyl synthetase family protein [Firmicutes bacterium HGW-Firmicutes-12]|nr:MAG: polyprenyl synthetase family protein [Firmicutes bacterium HGW-Firmicutes-12]